VVQRCAARNGGGDDDIGTAPEGAASESEVPSQCERPGERAALPVGAGFVRRSVFMLDSASCWTRRGVGLRVVLVLARSLRERQGYASLSGNGQGRAPGLVVLQRLSLGQPGGGAEQRPSRLERAGNRSGWPRDRAGAGGNPGADPNGTTIHRTCAGQPVQSEERQEGSRPQRCGTAADEEEAFVGRSADGNPAHDPTFPQGLERSMRGQRGEPQIRNRLQHAGTAYRRNPSRW